MRNYSDERLRKLSVSKDQGLSWGDIFSDESLIEPICQASMININRPFKKEYDKHLITWVPSIGVGNISFYKGNVFKEWSGDLIVVATKIKNIIRLVIENNKIQKKELILSKSYGRIRDLEINHRGEIFFIVDDNKSSLWKIEKAI